MKILATIFTYPPNRKYFVKCLEYLGKSCRFADEKIDLLIIDFGQNDRKEDDYDFPCMVLWKPGHGFGSNFNSAMSIALTRKYDYLLNINDDSFISEQFIKEGIDFLEANSSVGLVAGIPNQGGWGLELEDVEIPEPVHNIIDIEPLKRLWWEMSAYIARVETLRQTGPYDVVFDAGLSVVGDNDYFFRMQQQGWDLCRSGSMRFFHCKGITQMAFGRLPSRDKPDPHKERNLEYFYQKHGIRL